MWQWEEDETLLWEEMKMNPDEYSEKALMTMKDPNEAFSRVLEIGAQAVQLDNGLRGLVNEVGEIADVIKAYIEYGRDLDVVHLTEEIGDAIWRLNQIADAAGIKLSEAMVGNIRKLHKKRYKEGYSDEAAAEENRDREGEKDVVESASNESKVSILTGKEWMMLKGWQNHLVYPGGWDEFNLRYETDSLHEETFLYLASRSEFSVRPPEICAPNLSTFREWIEYYEVESDEDLSWHPELENEMIPLNVFVVWLHNLQYRDNVGISYKSSSSNTEIFFLQIGLVKKEEEDGKEETTEGN